MERLLFLRSLPPRLLLIYLALGVLFIFECKFIILRMRKETRFQFYNNFAKDVENEALQVETADNKTYILVQKLARVLGGPRARNRTISTDFSQR